MLLPMALASSFAVAAVDDGDHAGTMPSGMFPGKPMAIEGSGSAWLPASSSMDAVHGHAGAWMSMSHGALFPRFTAQNIANSGRRGGSRFDAPGWIMGAVSRGMGGGTSLTLRCMLSPDPLIEGGGGYPLLFQTGETWQGRPLVDRQHPHDLFSELSAAVAIALNDHAGAFVYAGYPGEPALGPVAFMHRPSCSAIPDAPLSHHWQDATHISFGVVSAGWFWKAAKLDVSLFNGREPDEDRYGFDRPRLTSVAGRVTLNPTAGTSFQLSHARLRQPEPLDSDEDATRSTVSATVVCPLPRSVTLIASLVHGRNTHGDRGSWGDAGPASRSLLLEAEARCGKLRTSARGEQVEKSAADLSAPGAGDVWYRVRALTVGASCDVASLGPIRLSLGTLVTGYDVPAELHALYGRHPISAQFYCHLRLATAERVEHGIPSHHQDHD